MKVDLTQEKTQELEAELRRRDNLLAKKAAEKEEVEEFDRWRSRPSCAVVGRAYGTPYANAKARNMQLASVTISGNVSWHYPIELVVAPSVETYFHNAWTRDDEAEFKEALKKLVESFVLAKCNDPAIITTLICLSESAGMRPLTGRRKEVYSEWHKEALITLSKFNKDELIKTKAKMVKSGDTCHGQIRLLDDALAQR